MSSQDGPRPEATRPGAGDAVLVRANRILTWLEGFGAFWAAISIFVTMLIVFVDVFLRYVFRAPLAWSYDLISLYLVPVLFFLVLSDTFRRDHHIAVDLVYLRMPETAKRIARLLIALIMIPVVWEIIFLSFKDAVAAYRNNEVLSGAILWPTWIPLVFVAVGFGLLLLRLGLDAISLGRALIGRSPVVTGESPMRSGAGSLDEGVHGYR